MRRKRISALALAVAILLARLLVILAAIEIAPLLGIHGWYIGLFANALCVVFAAAVLTWLRLWRGNGLGVLWRGWPALLFVIPLLVIEPLVWPLALGGLENLPPGYGLWGLTLLLVGINEELIDRVAVLRTLAGAYRRTWAVVLSAALFGLSHLSGLVLSSRAVEDVMWNVLLTGVYGFALAAYQIRFAWLWPLILAHAAADFTIILIDRAPPDLLVATVHIGLLVLGIALLRGRTRRSAGHGGEPARAVG